MVENNNENEESNKNRLRNCNQIRKTKEIEIWRERESKNEANTPSPSNNTQGKSSKFILENNVTFVPAAISGPNANGHYIKSFNAYEFKTIICKIIKKTYFF